MQAVPVNVLTNGSRWKNGNYATNAAGVLAAADFVYDYQRGAGTGNIWGQTRNTAGGAVLP